MSVRSIRDPIHGDILLNSIEGAIIDTRVFQRLRYIRQNGLLHLVFPGAVHTRFAHSLGTMDIARRVAESLFADVVDRSHGDSQRAAGYLSQAFRLAALLHDVGHCAFSHSIEFVTLSGGRPFLGTTTELFERWGAHDLLAAHLVSNPDAASEPATHEQIGLLLVARIFTDARVMEACARAGFDPEELRDDVLALMEGGLPVSERFRSAAEELAGRLPGSSLARAHEDLAKALQGLVSGTLDVDRLDYLVRDSIHCGVPYGLCEVDLLVRSLSIGVVDGSIDLLLDQKAAHALDDMLWSRYQLFLQVYNHKTNVGLNAALSEAIGEALRVGFVEAPKSLDDYLAFIDDRVIGRLFEFAQKPDTDLDDQPYIRILVDRRVPRHLRAQRLTPEDDAEERAARIRATLARDEGVPEQEIFWGQAKSELQKAKQKLPHLVDGRSPSRTKRPFDALSSVIGPRGVASGLYRVLHFFTTRETP